MSDASRQAVVPRVVAPVSIQEESPVEDLMGKDGDEARKSHQVLPRDGPPAEASIVHRCGEDIQKAGERGRR